MKTRVSVFLLVFPAISFSQTDSAPTHFGLSFGGGLAYNYLRYDFTSGPNDVVLQPRYSVAAFVTYGPIPLVGSTGLELAIQTQYSYLTTGSIESFVGTAELTRKHFSLMLWSKLMVSGAVTPYIETGIGIGSVQFKEHYSYAFADEGSLMSTGFAFGVGGGISFRLADGMHLETYTQTIYLLKDVTLEANRGSFTFLTPSVLILGARMNWSF